MLRKNFPRRVAARRNKRLSALLSRFDPLHLERAPKWAQVEIESLTTLLRAGA